MIEDLKRKDFIAIRPLDPQRVVTRGLKTDVSRAFHSAAPYVRFLCNALNLPF